MRDHFTGREQRPPVDGGLFHPVVWVLCILSWALLAAIAYLFI